MWPWEHIAFAYVCYSLFAHAVYRRSPAGWEVFALAFGSQFPDLVDKPLAWTFGVFDSGYAVAHSVFTLPILAAVVLLPLSRRGREDLAVGVAFLLAHVSHLVGDIIYPYILGDHLAFSAVLWPVVNVPGPEMRTGLLRTFVHYFVRWAYRLRDLDFGPLMTFEILLGVAVVSLWLYDGAPGVAVAWRTVFETSPDHR